MKFDSEAYLITIQGKPENNKVHLHSICMNSFHYKLCKSTINNTYLMYRHLLCRKHILLRPFGSPALFSTTSAAILSGCVFLRLNFRSKGYVSANIYGPLDTGMIILQLCRWKSSHKEIL